MVIKMTSTYKDYSIRPLNIDKVSDYQRLFGNTFNDFNPTSEYLNWLYGSNPRGLAVGFDAFHGEDLVAHYACIPIQIEGCKKKSLLSLNTATHPQHQGKGLFKTLAETTFNAQLDDFSNVIGVANSNSTSGFLKHLGFSKLGNLELRFGNLKRELIGSRVYSTEEIDWRLSCPLRPLKKKALKNGDFLISSNSTSKYIRIKSIISDENRDRDELQSKVFGLTLDWRRGATPIVKLPEKLKPSPLNLIFKSLGDSNENVLTSFSFPDFDAL